MLKPSRLATPGRKLAILETVPGATPRQRGRPWARRRAAWLREHPLCAHCLQAGIIRPAQEVDHITPLCEGGRDDESNFQSLCVECHQVKTANEAKGRARGY
jgi:5-methylcytosine-specific restriction protein A